MIKKITISALLIIAVSCSKKSTSPTPPVDNNLYGSGHYQFADYSTGISGSVFGSLDTGGGKQFGYYDISLSPSDITQGEFKIFNMPSDASGTFRFSDAADTISIRGSAHLYASYWGYPYATDTTYFIKNGTLTKTGSGTFTFTCTVGGTKPSDPPNPTTGYGSYNHK